MITKASLGFIAFSLLSSTGQVLGRENILERDGRPVYLYPRRFGQEQPAVLQKLQAACPGQVCGTLAGQAVTPLLAAQPECSQQDLADAIIDASKQFDAATQASMVAIAKEYRQAEKNTPPDFSTNPPTLRNSVFCQKAPKNPELNGLVQAQDPANDPNLFFDPATKATVRKGDQANTFPFGQAGGAADNAGNNGTAANDDTAAAADNNNAAATTAATTAAAAIATRDVAASNIGNFGSCSVPQIEFGVGFDNRKETSFQPVDQKSFNHGSAQNINIITQFICDTLTNSCNADATAKATCQTAQAAASAAAAKTGAQADAFNAAFGITTDFASVQPIDDQGRPVGAPAAAANNGAAAATAAASSAAATAAAASAAATEAPAAQQAAPSLSSPSNVGNFGSCSVPQIEFGVGFDNRKETSFQPVDQKSFNHGSAQNINIITQFICDTLTNSCNADAAAKATCQTAQAAASAAAAKTGAQADAFNAAFGISTDFASVQPIDDQGRPVGAPAAST